MLAVIVKYFITRLEKLVIKPLATLNQAILIGFAVLAYQAQSEEVQRQCVSNIDKYGCASSFNRYIFISYLLRTAARDCVPECRGQGGQTLESRYRA